MFGVQGSGAKNYIPGMKALKTVTRLGQAVVDPVYNPCVAFTSRLCILQTPYKAPCSVSEHLGGVVEVKDAPSPTMSEPEE